MIKLVILFGVFCLISAVEKSEELVKTEAPNLKVPTFPVAPYNLYTPYAGFSYQKPLTDLYYQTPYNYQQGYLGSPYYPGYSGYTGYPYQQGIYDQYNTPSNFGYQYPQTPLKVPSGQKVYVNYPTPSPYYHHGYFPNYVTSRPFEFESNSNTKA